MVERRGYVWPRLPSGAPALDAETFRTMAGLHPELEPLRQLRNTLGELRLHDLAVGPDGRNRVLLSAFRAKTGRNAPSSSKFIFGPATWARFLIKPQPGTAIAYIDWKAQEIGIAAALSGDAKLAAAVLSGDPYLAFAIGAQLAPPGRHQGYPRRLARPHQGVGARYRLRHVRRHARPSPARFQHRSPYAPAPARRGLSRFRPLA